MSSGPGLRGAQPLRQHAGAFDGHHEELAALYGGWAGGAVTNADLTFTTLARARTAPGLADATNSNVAVGLIMAAHGVPEATARHLLGEAAARAGVSVAGWPTSCSTPGCSKALPFKPLSLFTPP